MLSNMIQSLPSLQIILVQLFLGLINGSFYALVSLGLAITFGLLRIVNFAHGSLYMLGAFSAYLMLTYLGLGYWPAIIIVPPVVGAVGAGIEWVFLRRIRKLNYLYSLLLTFGLGVIIEGLFRQGWGSLGEIYPVPEGLTGGWNLGFIFLPRYRVWAVFASLFICLVTWFIVERTRLGSYLRAATERPDMVRALGINVPRLLTLTFAFGAALAGIAGVLAAPIYTVSAQMGSSLLTVVFAVIVIGGMGSIAGAIVAGYSLGLLEGITKIFYPEGAGLIIFIAMALVLLIRPTGLFAITAQNVEAHSDGDLGEFRSNVPLLVWPLLIAAGLIAPFVLYPVFVMHALCVVLFACAFNLLLGYSRLLSLGHGAFFGAAAYLTAESMKAWQLPPELSIVIGVAVASFLGLVIGLLVIRRRGVTFAMVTMAFAELVHFFFLRAPFAGGENGIQSVPRHLVLGFLDINHPITLYYFVFAFFILGFFVYYRTIHSPFGLALKAIGQNETKATSLGYDTIRHKLAAFVLSAALAGLAGGLKVMVFQLATLDDVSWSASSDIVLATLIGGLGTIFGPVAGGFVMVWLKTYLADTGSWVMIVQGVFFVACVLMFRRGIVGVGEHLLPSGRSSLSRPSEPSTYQMLAKRR